MIVGPELDRAAIRKNSDTLLMAVNASDIDGCLAVWADDGEMMPPHHPAVKGSVALREFFASLFSNSRFEFAFTSSRITIAADTALETVTYTVLAWFGDARLPTEDAGKGLHVYKRQSDGSWKLAIDIWNSDCAEAAT